MTRVSKHWTGINDPKSKILPPTSDNYNDWTADHIRKECTNREMACVKSLKKDERIKVLELHDRIDQNHKKNVPHPVQLAVIYVS